MAGPVIQPNDRWAIVGKTGSGKTTAAVAITAAILNNVSDRWRAQILWTKTDSKDERLFKEAGFRKGSHIGQGRAIYIPIRPTAYSVADQCQMRLQDAIERRFTMTLLDEYTSAIYSTRNPGFYLKEALVRGRGNQVGVMVGNQEPAEVPRTYMTQATHCLIFDLWSNLDLAQIRKVFPAYTRPPDKHGFWYCWTTGPAIWQYFPDWRTFLDGP